MDEKETTEVRDHIPLEQGLRRLGSNAGQERRQRQRPYSIRTRIKTKQVRGRTCLLQGVRDHIPLEQGLRRMRN